MCSPVSFFYIVCYFHFSTVCHLLSLCALLSPGSGDSAEQQRIHRSPKKEKWKSKHLDGKPLSLWVSQEAARLWVLRSKDFRSCFYVQVNHMSSSLQGELYCGSSENSTAICLLYWFTVAFSVRVYLCHCARFAAVVLPSTGPIKRHLNITNVTRANVLWDKHVHQCIKCIHTPSVHCGHLQAQGQFCSVACGYLTQQSVNHSPAFRSLNPLRVSLHIHTDRQRFSFALYIDSSCPGGVWCRWEVTFV